MRGLTGIALIALAAGVLNAQTVAKADARPEFEVASVKPAPPPEPGKPMMMGSPRTGPGTADPTLFRCNNCPLSMLVMQAYGLKRYQFSGPSWMDTERYNIEAKAPEGVTKEQYLQMQQRLLEERFQIKVHRETKEMQVYDLVVGKGGHKMTKSEELPPSDPKDAPPGPPIPMGRGGPPKLDKDGFPILPDMRGARGPMIMMTPGKARMKATQESMDDFATMLSNQLGKPVTNGTGLKGKYDFTLSWVPDMSMMRGPGGMMPPPPPGGAGGGGQIAIAGGPIGGPGGMTPGGGADESGPTLIGAVQSQLGLKLDTKKGQVEMLIVEKAEKVPTEN